MTGVIPRCFKSLTQLVFLQLIVNGMGGEIPAELGALTKLTFL
eukprot:jgi/Mesen1/768/ME000110S_11035